MIDEIRARLREHADPDRAVHAVGYFKAGPGEYAEGDRFIGVRVPEVRKLARKYRAADRSVVLELLRSEIHEERLLALLILVDRFSRGDAAVQRDVYSAYMAHRQYVNNWDLVDTAAPAILGGYLFARDRAILEKLAGSRRLWDRRMAVLATLYFIRRDDFSTTLTLADRLLADPHDLIHKAVGWMLREIGNRDPGVLTIYLEKHASAMPRIMLRYAIEKLPREDRERWLGMPRMRW